MVRGELMSHLHYKSFQCSTHRAEGEILSILDGEEKKTKKNIKKRCKKIKCWGWGGGVGRRSGGESKMFRDEVGLERKCETDKGEKG